jgi:hypothetical protein
VLLGRRTADDDSAPHRTSYRIGNGFQVDRMTTARRITALGSTMASCGDVGEHLRLEVWLAD